MTRICLAIAVALFALGTSLPAFPQSEPKGDSVLNQGLWSLAISPSDTQALPYPTRAIFNGNSTACNIVMTLTNDTVKVTWNNVQPGEILAVAAKQVFNTNTTCTGLVGIY